MMVAFAQEPVTPFQTKMNLLQKLYPRSKTQKIILVFSVVVIAVLPFVLIKLFSKPQPIQTPQTVPVIPIITLDEPKVIIPLNTTNPHNPEQKLVFNWGSLPSQTFPTIKNYRISAALINTPIIMNAASRLGFTALEKSQNTSENSHLWLKNNMSFFGSTKQNQIMFISTSEIPKHTTNIRTDEAIAISQNIILNLFGETLIKTLNPTPEIKYLDLNPQIEDEPSETTPELANIVNINFQQTIDNLPLINLSKRGETISVAIDTTKKLYLLYVYGGFLRLTENGETTPRTFSQLKESAPSQAIRISQSKDIPSEAAYTKVKTVNIAVKEVNLGYFQRADNSLFPVFIIKGNMSSKGLAEFPATYIVPASAN